MHTLEPSRYLQLSCYFGGLKKLMISTIAVLGAELHKTAETVEKGII
jgi:hypothetical protein